MKKLPEGGIIQTDHGDEELQQLEFRITEEVFYVIYTCVMCN